MSAGVGLRGMHERIQQLGGTLEIESGGQGTTVTAVLPIAVGNSAKL
jgi:signal transduction histidine kinase